MSQRNDIHRPSAITPEDYDFVAFDYIGGSDLSAILMLKAERNKTEIHMEHSGGKWASVNHGGTCYVCGACAMYLCIWHNRVTNEYIKTGEDCAAKMDMSYGDSNQFRKAIHTALHAIAGKKKALQLLTDAGVTRAWDIYQAMQPRREAEQAAFEASGHDQSRPAFALQEELKIESIVSTVIRYGSLSDKQVDFLKVLFARVDDAPARQAAIDARKTAEAAITAAAPDVPNGRQVITGTVLGLKEVEDYSRFGGMKCNALIQTTEGYKIYGSRFANVNKGDTVKFTATLKRSDRDAKFGFFKRPALYVPKVKTASAALMRTIAWG